MRNDGDGEIYFVWQVRYGILVYMKNEELTARRA